jgi:hypothetical protein
LIRNYNAGDFLTGINYEPEFAVGFERGQQGVFWCPATANVKYQTSTAVQLRADFPPEAAIHPFVFAFSMNMLNEFKGAIKSSLSKECPWHQVDGSSGDLYDDLLDPCVADCDNKECMQGKEECSLYSRNLSVLFKQCQPQTSLAAKLQKQNCFTSQEITEMLSSTENSLPDRFLLLGRLMLLLNLHSYKTSGLKLRLQRHAVDLRTPLGAPCAKSKCKCTDVLEARRYREAQKAAGLEKQVTVKGGAGAMRRLQEHEQHGMLAEFVCREEGPRHRSCVNTTSIEFKMVMAFLQKHYHSDRICLDVPEEGWNDGEEEEDEPEQEEPTCEHECVKYLTLADGLVDYIKISSTVSTTEKGSSNKGTWDSKEHVACALAYFDGLAHGNSTAHLSCDDAQLMAIRNSSRQFVSTARSADRGAPGACHIPHWLPQQ